MPVCYIHNDKEVRRTVLEDHHMVPRAYDGPDVPDNMVLLCPTCHTTVHAMGEMFYRGNGAAARQLAAEYLLNEPKRQERIMRLGQMVATARQASAEKRRRLPEPGEHDDNDTVLVTLEIPRWLHHSLKSLAPAGKFYASLVEILRQHGMNTRQRNVEHQRRKEATLHIHAPQSFDLLKL